IIGRDKALNWGLSGPILRALGIEWDLNKNYYYDSYGEFHWQALEGILGGPYENLEMHICKKPSPTFELTKQELYDIVEAPKGEFGIFPIGDQSVFPWRWKIRSPGFLNFQIVPQLVKRMKWADIRTVLGNRDITMEKLVVEMIINTTELETITSFSKLVCLKEVYGIIWMCVPIVTLVLGITICVLRNIFGNTTRYQALICRPFRVSSSSIRWDKTTFERELYSIYMIYSFIQYGTVNTSIIYLLFSIVPSILVISIFQSYSTIPFGDHLVVADLSIGVFLGLPSQVLLSLDFLCQGGLWEAPQSINYETPLALCVLSIFGLLSQLITQNSILLEQVKGIGIIGTDEALNWLLIMSLTNNLSAWFNGNEGNSLARYLVRISEMTESIKIIQQDLEGIPGRPCYSYKNPTGLTKI
uniref:NADH-quinone oxidoreductase subunit D domain-containing protein n=1 Tax=Solanum lycopersicum TaxID=4081 RepID=A0A3Q7HAK4_SOLLC